MTKSEVLKTLKVLRDDYKVNFVVVGGAGFTLHSGLPAADIDVVTISWGKLLEHADEVSLFSDGDEEPPKHGLGAATAVIAGVSIDFLEPNRYNLKDIVFIRGFKVLSKAQLIATMKPNDPNKIKKLRSLITSSTQPRGSWSGIWYHGDRADRSNFKTQQMDRSEDKDQNAQGPGIYFTRSKEQAAGYGPYLYEVKIRSNQKRILKESMKPDPKLISRFIDLAPAESKSYGLSNWDDEPERAKSTAVTAYANMTDLHSALIGVYHDFYGHDYQEYAKAMVKLGFDAFLHQLPAVDHLIVFNPESIVILSKKKKKLSRNAATEVGIDPKVLEDLEMYLEHNYSLPMKTIKELRRLLETGEAEEYIHEPTVKWAYHGMTVTKSWLKSVGVVLKPNLAELRADFVYGNVPSAWTTSEKLASRHFTVRSDFDNNKVDVILVAKVGGQNEATFVSGPNGFYKLVGQRQSNEQELLAIEPVKVSRVVIPAVIQSLKATRVDLPIAASQKMVKEMKMKSEILYKGARYQKVSKIIDTSTSEVFRLAKTKSGRKMWKDISVAPISSPKMTRSASSDEVVPVEAEQKGILNKDQELVQYIDKGNFMSPAGTITLAPKLKAGVYQVVRTMQGIGFERQAISTDSLLRFKDPIHTEILSEMDTFWNRKEKMKKKGFLHNRSVLMYGPPGSGKSCIIKIATEDLVGQGDIVFVAERYISDLVDGLKIFREIEPNRRCLAIMEDVDEMGEHSLLQLLDGTNTADNVMYLATTNYVDRLPDRVLRPGRFGRKIEVPYPPEAGRRAYLESKLADEEMSPEAMDDLIKKTSGFSFGHLRELVTAVYCMGQPLDKTLKRLRGTGLEANASPKPYSDGDEER